MVVSNSKNTVINPHDFGVTFSVKQCRGFGTDPEKTLDWLLARGWRRFRLMSYWNEHEKTPGRYDFTELDRQIDAIEKKDGVVSLCLGVKQPRWPEYHWPGWALELEETEKTRALMSYIEVVVERYKHRTCIISYQLENEALLKGFGRNIDINRTRLRAEYQLIRELDPPRPIHMSTSNGWGIPLRRPIPHHVGFSMYTVMHQKGAYRNTIQKPWLHRTRRRIIKLVLRRPVFIHELQCEPWGPDAIWKLTKEQQDESMPPERIAKNIAWAKRIGSYPIDLWGGEWWYWRWQKKDKTVWNTVQSNLSDS